MPHKGSPLDLMYLKADKYQDRPALSWKENHEWHDLSFADVSESSRELSDYLIHYGIKADDRLALLSEARPEWSITFFATIRSAAILVPLDPKLTSSEMLDILQNARPRMLFVSDQFLKKAEELKNQVSSIEQIILVSSGNAVPGTARMKDLHSVPSEGRQRQPGDTALIVYTSGTVGTPKGVLITFANLMFQVESLEHVFGPGRRDRFLSVLPPNHLLELTAGLLGVLHAGGQICYCQSLFPHELSQAMREKQITIMITVPMLLKMLKDNIEREISASTAFQQTLFRLLFRLSKRIPSWRLKQLLFRRVHKRLGGKIRGFVSGGAPLDLQVADFFDRIGIPIYQGYGLTEASPVVSTNTCKYTRRGSVGKPLKGVEVKIQNTDEQDDGEILTRGPHIMKGYYGAMNLTSSVIDADGWLHTGDTGYLDKHGFLYITGRSKNLIVLGGGKKVHPEEVEQILLQAPSIADYAS